MGLLLLFLLPFYMFGQEGFFRVPFDFPLFLSGNFAELRSNHFHGGLDFKTQGVEGKPLYCPADGYNHYRAQYRGHYHIRPVPH